MIELRVLGGVELKGADGGPLEAILAGPKRLALLTFLAVQAPRLQRRDSVVGLLWPEVDQAHARNALRNLLHAMRRALGEGVLAVSGDEELGVDPDRLRCDACAFQEAIRDRRLSDALDIYRGDLLEGFFLPGAPEFEGWLDRTRSSLREQAVRSAWALTEAHENRGALRDAVGWARRAVALSPYDEAAIRRLVSLLDLVGDRAGALAEYRGFAERLASELEVDPTAETQETIGRLRGDRATAIPRPLARRAASAAAPRPESVAARAADLPLPPTRFLGREAELGALEHLVLDPAVRLVSLTGPGGVGKTRLALEAAVKLTPHFEQGVAFVPLAAVGSPELVQSAIARALGVREDAEDLSCALRDRIRRGTLLLVLDNFEHVLGGAPRVAELIRTCPGLTALVTSRSVLRLQGEHELRLGPLVRPQGADLPPLEILAGYPAVALFIERARAAEQSFQLTSENAPAIAEICARLDGLPLAIELAAARVKLLSPESMLARISGGLQILSGGSRDLPERHQTLRSAIGWSYDLLESDARVVLRRLAVFAGGFTVDGVQAVCLQGVSSDALDVLSTLVDESLVHRLSDAAGEARFSMLETIREYALERLRESGEEELCRRRHAEAFVGLAEEAEAAQRGGGQSLWLRRLQPERENLRAVLAWALGNADVDTIARLTAPIWWFWWTEGLLTEGRRWLAAALESEESLPLRLRAKTLHAAGALAYQQGDIAATKILFERALEVARELQDRALVGRSLCNVAVVHDELLEHAEARRLLEESLSILRDVGETDGISHALHNLANNALALEDYDRAEQLFLEALELDRARGDHLGAAVTLGNLGETARSRGDLPHAILRYEQALAIDGELGGNARRPALLLQLAQAWAESGDKPRALELYHEAVEAARATGDWRTLSGSVLGLAELALREKQPGRAARLYGAFEILRSTTRYRLRPNEEARRQENVAVARRELGAEAFAAAWAVGTAMSAEQTAELALGERRPEMAPVTSPR